VFVRQAHSFRQQATLAITLAWVAGYTNIITIIVCGSVTSHVTGTASNLGRDVVDAVRGTPHALTLAFAAFYLLFTFLVGAILSGVFTEFGKARRWESIYVLPMAVEALLLTIFALGIEFISHESLRAGPANLAMIGVASAAMGLQNATITRISSGVVRTTHVTGVLTDLGLELVQLLIWLKRRVRDAAAHDGPADISTAPQHVGLNAALHHALHHAPRRAVLLTAIFASFILGAALGTLGYVHAPALCMLPPVGFLLWLIYQDLTTPIAEISPSDLVTSDLMLALPPGIAVYHLRKERERGRRIHRMPDLLEWARRLPRDSRIVILDIADGELIDSDAAVELRAVLDRFREEKRTLILAGLTFEHFKRLRRASTQDIDLVTVCPDLEFAIARGLMMLDRQSSWNIDVMDR
jgi:uncharacterized membrane protein YoaK (UPF0700 family)